MTKESLQNQADRAETLAAQAADDELSYSTMIDAVRLTKEQMMFFVFDRLPERRDFESSSALDARVATICKVSPQPQGSDCVRMYAQRQLVAEARL
jgi:hypothetical protein